VDLPTYTNIWRIEKRLYKLYDFRLPAPLPITWIGVFVAITVPYVVFLIAVGLPFNHTLVWLYILPPGVLTWLTTRPVIESKRLPELVSSQLRYVAEPRTWCRMAPFAEKDEILVTARVWHGHPPKARPKKAKRSTAKARSSASVLQVPAEESPQAVEQPVTGRAAALPLASAQPTASPPVASPASGPTAPPSPTQVQVPERAPARRTPKLAKAHPDQEPSWSPWPRRSEPDTSATGSAAEPVPEPGQRPAWMISLRSKGTPDVSGLEVAHDPGVRGLSEPHAPFVPMSWPSPEASLLPLLRPPPEPSPFPEAGPFPEVGPFPEAGPFPQASPVPEPDAGHGAELATSTEPAAGPEPAADPAYDAPLRSEPAAGSGRRLRSGLLAGLGRKPGRAPGSIAPAPPMEVLPPAEASPPAEARPQATPGWPEVPPAPARPKARWMLRAQSLPSAAAPLPAESLPQTWESAPEPLASPAAAAAELAASDALPPAKPEPASVAPESAPADPAPAPQERTPASQTPASAPAEAAAPAPAMPTPTAPAEPAAPAPAMPASAMPAPNAPAPAAPAPAAAKFVSVERERPLPTIERALSGPGSRDEVSWRRQVKVVAGGQGPGKRDRETLDRDRARLPLAGPLRIAVLGCTRGAGQTVTALMTGHILAAVRGQAVAALDLNPGATSLAARRAPAASVQALLAGQGPSLPGGRGSGARLDVIADPPGTGGARALGGHDFQRLADLLAERYPLTLIDPAPSGLTRVLVAADQLVLVAPASPDAATSLANTQQWLGAHGYGELVGRAVMVVNGVSRRTMQDVLRAESVARGRCRAIVRVPWDDLLSARPGSSSTPPGQTALHPQTRLAYTALAGVLVAGMAADPSSPVPGRNPGEHSD
jgi:MinD-like ATPase involved in chromosome partitioning or flagellar assembly